MYVLTTVDGEAYRKPSGLPAIFQTIEELNTVVEEAGLDEWAAVNIETDEAEKLIRNAWYAMHPTRRL